MRTAQAEEAFVGCESKMNQTNLRYTQKLTLTPNIQALMEWCRQHGYAYTTKFGSDNLADSTITKKEAEK